jgi:DNA-binding MarR family transcriptional regulator
MARTTKAARPQKSTPKNRQQDALLAIVVAYGRPVSAKELAELTGSTLGATAYHVRTLAKDGFIEWTDERRVRGAFQTFYKATPAGEGALRAVRTDALLTLFGELVVPAKDDGYPQAVALDDEARGELAKVVEQLRPKVKRILGKAAERGRG